MAACYRRILLSSVFILHSTAQPIFNCPMTVSVGDSAKLTCSNLTNSVIIKNPAGITVGNCVGRTTCVIPEGIEGKDIVLMDNNTILLTVQDIDKDDEGVWTCESGSTAECSLMVYKLPPCEISSTSSTNNLSLGQDLTLNISLTDYYCPNNIAWDLTIRNQSQNVTGFRDREETDDIRSRIVTYSPTVTSSLTGRVELTFNCNDETYDVSCSGVNELQLRDPPTCKLTSDDDTDDLTVGSNLTLQADIEEYPCTTSINYALVSGSVMVAELVKNAKSFYAKFKVKPEYLDKQLHLKYTCNSVSGTTRTEGVTILLTKGGLQHATPSLLIGLLSGVVGFVIIIIVIVCCIKHRKSTTKNDLPYSDVQDTVPRRKNSLKVTANDTYTEVSDVTTSLKSHHFEASDTNGDPKRGIPGNQKLVELREVTDREGDLNDKPRPRSECVMVPNVAYESVDDIRLKPKTEQNGNHLICPESTYAKVDKPRSQDIGAPDLLVSTHG